MGEHKENDPNADKVRVVFDIEKGTVDATAEHVHIVGSVPALGEWDVFKAKVTGYSGLNKWILEEFFEPHSEVLFNLCLLQYPKRGITSEGGFNADVTPTFVHTEDGWTRRLRLTDVPLHVRMTYNSKEVYVTQLWSSLTEDGGPVRLFQENTELNFVPRAGGWDFTEKENRLKLRYFDRVETSVMNGKVYTTIKQSLEQERLRDECMRLQKEAVGQKKREAEIKEKVDSEQFKSTACQAEIAPTVNDPISDILMDSCRLRSQMIQEPAVGADGTRQENGGERKKMLKLKKMRKKHKKNLKVVIQEKEKKERLDQNQNIVQMKVDESRTAEIQVPDEPIVDTTLATNGSSSKKWSRAMKIAAPIGLGLGAAAAAVYFWLKHG